jgi:carboxyl-terminal processing protease
MVMFQKSLYILSAFLFLAISSPTDNRREFEISRNLEIFAQVYKELNGGFVDEIDPGKLMRTGITAMVASLDPFTNYYPESDIEKYRIQNEGKSNNAGFDFRFIQQYATITEIYEGQSADKAGIKTGDQIIAIDGKDTYGKSAEEVDFFLRGTAGSSVSLTLRRPGSTSEIKTNLVRGDFEVPNVPYFSRLENDIAYISLTTFTPRAGRNVSNALRDMRQENPDLKGVILDLRENGGGLLMEAISVCNVFIPKNSLVVTTKGRIKEQDRLFNTTQDATDTEIPLVVLINRRSASASEIVSGVIQDYDRGVVIGQRSYGKGLVQNTVDVGYNARLKLTTSKYYIPSGRSIQSVEYKNGEPVEVPDDKKVAYKTLNNRTVYDGGGVSPDLPIQHPDNIPVIQSILRQDIIFRFVSRYANSHKSTDINNLKFNDFDQFLSFIRDEQIEFETEANKAWKEFARKSKEEGYALTETQKLVNEALEKEQKGILEKYKTEIMNLIEKEIAARHFYASGRIKIGLRNDPEVKEAIQLLRQPLEYSQLLGSKQ